MTSLPPARGPLCGTGWLALSDHDRLLRDDLPAVIAQGTLVAELEEPLPGPVLLLDVQGAGAALSVFADPAQGVGVLLRRGGAVQRLWLAGALPAAPGLGRLLLRWSATTGQWLLRHERRDLGLAREIRGTGAQGLPAGLIGAACAAGGRHPALLWFGVTDRAVPPPGLPWIGQRTPVATPTGPRAAGVLRAGEYVMGADGEARMLRRVARVALPARGNYAPILLRAPYFGLTQDLLVSADQRLRFHGTPVEYLFGEDAVLVAARDLADGVLALRDGRRAVTTAVLLDVGPQAVLQGPGIGLLSAAPETGVSPPPHRMLARYEAIALAARLRRRGAPRAA